MIYIYWFCILCFVISAFFGLLRFLRGPNDADRVIVSDLLASLLMAVAVFAGVYFDQDVYLDVALLIALVAFIGTVAAAYFFQKNKES